MSSAATATVAMLVVFSRLHSPGVSPVEVVSDAPVIGIELDAIQNLAPIATELVFLDGQLVCFHQLHLQRHREAIGWSAKPSPEQSLAIAEERPSRERLLPVEIRAGRLRPPL